MDLTNHFLIAMPTLDDPNFEKTVTYICAHNDDGAMGIVINRPLEMDLGEVLSQLELDSDNPEVSANPVFHGGPIHTDRGFVLHRPALAWESTMQVTAELGVSTSRDILQAIAEGEGPEELLVALGYAGWSGGQLEAEMAQNAWLSGPADLAVVFATPPQKRWQQAARIIGVDIAAVSHDVGHA